MIDGWGISCEIALIWRSLDFNDEKSALVLVMAWYCQATSHYLSQCWPRSLSPYGVTRPQWIKFTFRSPRGQWVNSQQPFDEYIIYISELCQNSQYLLDVFKCIPWKIIFVFVLKFPLSFFLKFQLAKCQNCFTQWLVNWTSQANP